MSPGGKQFGEAYHPGGLVLTRRLADLDARPAAAYTALLAGAGLRPVVSECHDDATYRMIDQTEARLRLVTMTAPDRAAALGLDLDRAGDVLTAARHAVADGILGYHLIVAEKPTAPRHG